MTELADYRIDVYNDSGVQQTSLIGTAAGGSDNNAGFLSASCLKRVNAPGMLQLSLRGDHPLLSTLADKWQFELWRKPSGSTWAMELAGIFREGQWNYTNKSNITLNCPGIASLLEYRIIDYPADTANLTFFDNVPAETIMKTMVSYNCASAALTANGRKRAGTNWPGSQITVQADSATGESVDWYCYGHVLLESLQKLALIAGGDFDLVKTSPTAYEFRWYTGQLGTDRTATVKFALGLGNMGMPEYLESWIEEKTVACVWGQGEGAGRDYATVTGTNYAAGNDIEVYVDARDVELGNTAGLSDKGAQKLREMEAVRAFKFDALQAPATLYGVHYFLGDLVKVVNPKTGAEYTQKVTAIVQTLGSEGDQGIEVELSAP
jgi:hypothetical protein